MRWAADSVIDLLSTYEPEDSSVLVSVRSEAEAEKVMHLSEILFTAFITQGL